MQESQVVAFRNALEIQIRLSQRQSASQIAEVLSLPLVDVQCIELVCRYLQGRDCEALCSELGIQEASLDGLSDQFLEAKFAELWNASHTDLSEHGEHIRTMVNLERGRAAINPKDATLQAFSKELGWLEMDAKNKIVKQIASGDTNLQAKLEKVKEQDQLDQIALAQKDFDVTDPSSGWDDYDAPRRKKKAKSTDRYDLLRERGTNGHNYDIQTNQIIRQLEEWSKDCKFKIADAGHDWVELKFTTLPKDLNAFANAVHRFCPDVVDQGTKSVAALVDDIRQSRRLRLWWD